MGDWNDAVDDIVLDDSLVAAACNEDRRGTESGPCDALAPLDVLLASLKEGLTLIGQWCSDQRDQIQCLGGCVTVADPPTSERLSELVRQAADLTGRLGRLALPATDAPKEQPEDTGDSACGEPADLEDSVAVPPPAAETMDWERLLLGEPLCQLASLAVDRKALMDGVLRREDAAVGLAGRLMLVQAAATDEMPLLLKDIGEAYYRWRPKAADTEDAFEQALATALRQRIAAVGLRNAIELVRVGDRYDSSRHTSADRGIEVTAVRGWVVVRENGKALTKANVSLR